VDPRIFERYRTGLTIRSEIAQLGTRLEAEPPEVRRPVELAVLDLLQEHWDSAHLQRVS
jgi:hypothetical protein